MNSDILDFQIFLAPDQKKEAFSIIGSNQNEICIVYSTEATQKDDLAFLEKILGAVKLSFDNDVVRLEVHQNENISFSKLKQSYSINKCIVFGISPQKLGLNFDCPKYQFIPFNGIQYLYSDSLEMIAQDKELKAALWAALKTMFL